MTKVLVIDDDASVRLAIRQIIEPAGFPVEDAETAEQAFAVVERGDPDLALLILDLGLPGATGIQFLRELRERVPEAAAVPPVLIVSGDTTLHGAAAGYKAGAKLYLTKPFSADELLLAVQALTRPRRVR